MKKTLISSSLLALATALVAGLAAAAAGDSPLARAGDGTRLVVLAGGDGAESFALGDLADGESRTFQGKSGTVTVTRKGDALEVAINGEDGERTVVVTSPEGGEGKLLLRKVEGGAEPHVVVRRHAGATDGAAWTGKDGELVEITEGDAHAVFVGPAGHRHVFVGESGAHATAAGGGDGFVWSTGGAEVLHFRCAEDDVFVGGPKEKLDTVAPVCPVCGKAMERLAGARHRSVQVKVREEEGGEKPQI